MKKTVNRQLRTQSYDKNHISKIEQQNRTHCLMWSLLVFNLLYITINKKGYGYK